MRRAADQLIGLVSHRGSAGDIGHTLSEQLGWVCGYVRRGVQKNPRPHETHTDSQFRAQWRSSHDGSVLHAGAGMKECRWVGGRYLEVAGADVPHLLKVHGSLLKYALERLSELLMCCPDVRVFLIVRLIWNGPALQF